MSRLKSKENCPNSSRKVWWLFVATASIQYFLSLPEEKMFAELWEKDYISKCNREEMEAAMQLERNREMLRVNNLIPSYTNN